MNSHFTSSYVTGRLDKAQHFCALKQDYCLSALLQTQVEPDDDNLLRNGTGFGDRELVVSPHKEKRNIISSSCVLPIALSKVIIAVGKKINPNNYNQIK